MNQETFEMIDRLAAQLGTTAGTLVGWYAERVSALWVAPAIWTFVFFMSVIAGAVLFVVWARFRREYQIQKDLKRDHPSTYDFEAGLQAYYGVHLSAGFGAFFLFLSFVFFVAAVTDWQVFAVAIASPEAYAVDQLMKQLWPN